MTYSFNDHGLAGPLIRVPLGALVDVKVRNSVPDAGTTVHFHGIHFEGTPYFDGSQNVGQAAIPAMATGP